MYIVRAEAPALRQKLSYSKGLINFNGDGS